MQLAFVQSRPYTHYYTTALVCCQYYLARSSDYLPDLVCLTPVVSWPYTVLLVDGNFAG